MDEHLVGKLQLAHFLPFFSNRKKLSQQFKFDPPIVCRKEAAKLFHHHFQPACQSIALSLPTNISMSRYQEPALRHSGKTFLSHKIEKSPEIVPAERGGWESQVSPWQF